MIGSSLAGSLLVASPQMGDANFSRTVILVLDHDDEGALGVVLNRPSPLPVASVLPVWADLTDDPGVVFEGGPVDAESALALARMPGLSNTAEPPSGVRPLVGDLCLLDLDGDPDFVSPKIDGLRVFAGYAGWAPEQLEDEVAEQAWFVVGADHADPFSHGAENLWRAVLRRQVGDLRLISTFPEDPTLN